MQIRKSRFFKNFNEQEQLRNLLREIRVERGLRQIDLANQLGIPQSYISKYESGERNLDVLELRSICKALNISFIDFIKKLDERLKFNNET